MAARKHIFIDIEATGDGTDSNHNVIEIGAEIWLKGKPIDDIWIQMKPDQDVVYKDLGEGRLAHYDRAQQYLKEDKPDQKSGWFQWIDWLDKHINKYNSYDKFVVLAYNAGFDQRHVINLFKRHKNKYMGAYFKAPFVCINEFSLLALNGELDAAKDRKLATLGRIMGLEIEDKYLHQAWYDAKLAARLYQRLVSKFRSSPYNI